MKKQMLKSALIALAGVGLMSGGALATPITGEINFNGLVTVENAIGNAVSDYTLGKQLDFDNAVLNMDVAAGSGLFASIPVGTKGTIQDFIFDPVNASLPVDPLWSFVYNGVTFTFKMTGLTVQYQATKNLILEGSGVMYGVGSTNYDPTPGTWEFSTGKSTINGIGAFSWQATGAASPVPEPATMLLFGTGLAGLAGIARRRKAE